MNHEIRGWNECLITYVLAAASPRHAIEPGSTTAASRRAAAFATASRTTASSCRSACRYGGPLFFTHYSFCGLDPRGLKDRYADYWDQNVRHVRINRAHCVANPRATKATANRAGASPRATTRTATPRMRPDNDNGTISPTAALASLPYAPAEVMPVLRHFLDAARRRGYGATTASSTRSARAQAGSPIPFSPSTRARSS